MAAKPKSINIWEWTDDNTNWTKFLPSDIDKVEGGYQQTQSGALTQGFAEMGQMSWNTPQDKTRYRFDFKKMTQMNLSTKKERGIRRRTQVPCCPKLHELTYLADTPKEYSARGLIAVCDDCSQPVSTQGYYHCSFPKCEFDRCMACQGEKIRVKQYSSMSDWQNAFTGLSTAQLTAMTKDVSASAELRKENLSIVWRTWTDVARSYESEDGQNTTDMTFFAIAPAATRPKDVSYSTLPDSSFVPFPAVRSPNYFDTIDVLPNTDALSFMAKNRAGVASRVTLSQFLANIGSYIADLEPRESWSDAIDATPLQLGSQFSILPVPTGRADIGVAAFGKGNVNLHIIVGPGGDIGWAPEAPGAGKRIYFKSGDGKQLRAISLVPEKRTDVKKAFFKVEVHQESIAEEKERYQDTKNRLLHLQVEMAGLLSGSAPPTTTAATGGRRDAGEIRKNCGHALVAFSTPFEGSHTCDSCMRVFPQGTRLNGCRPCDFDLCDQCIMASPQSDAFNRRNSLENANRTKDAKEKRMVEPLQRLPERRGCRDEIAPSAASSVRSDDDDLFAAPPENIHVPHIGSLAKDEDNDWEMADVKPDVKPANNKLSRNKHSSSDGTKKKEKATQQEDIERLIEETKRLEALSQDMLCGLDSQSECLESQSQVFASNAAKTSKSPSSLLSKLSSVKLGFASPPPTASAPTTTSNAGFAFGAAPAAPPKIVATGGYPMGAPGGPSPFSSEPVQFQQQSQQPQPQPQLQAQGFSFSSPAKKPQSSPSPAPPVAPFTFKPSPKPVAAAKEQEAKHSDARSRRKDESEGGAKGAKLMKQKSKPIAVVSKRMESEDDEDEAADESLFDNLAGGAQAEQAQQLEPEVVEMDAGIQLAEVAVGDVLGSAGPGDMVPMKVNGKERASRKAGVAVRASWLYYGVTGDGAVDAERLRRFVKQMLFERREKQLQFGSLVSGFGSWGGPENAPIKLFGLRLTDAVDTTPKTAGIPPVQGIRALPVVGLREACVPLKGVVSGVDGAVATALQRAKAVGKASCEHTAAVYLYTMASDFYRNLNAALRDPNRQKLKPYYSYLRLLAEAMVVLPARGKITLWRGVGLDLEKDHALGTEVTWWGVSSCTPKLSVAQGFLGSSGPRTLFSVNSNTAVPIQELSAFKGEEEYILAPGTRLRVESINREAGGLLKVVLGELPPPRHVD